MQTVPTADTDSQADKLVKDTRGILNSSAQSKKGKLNGNTDNTDPQTDTSVTEMQRRYKYYREHIKRLHCQKQSLILKMESQLYCWRVTELIVYAITVCMLL